MNVAEATRQYQLALEYRRAAVAAAGHLLSMEDEVTAIGADVKRAEAVMNAAWLRSAVR